MAGRTSADPTCWLGLFTTAKLRKAFTYEVQDVSGDRKTGEAIALLACAQIKLLEDTYHANVIAIISDAAGEAAKARRLVQQAMPHIISLNCFSHQMNLIVGGSNINTSCAVQAFMQHT